MGGPTRAPERPGSWFRARGEPGRTVPRERSRAQRLTAAPEVYEAPRGTRGRTQETDEQQTKLNANTNGVCDIYLWFS